MITMDDYREVGKAIDFATSQDTLNLVVQDEEMHVKGDPSDTKVEKHDYTIRFAFPNTEKYRKILKKEQILKETKNYLLVAQTFTDVFVSPRMHSAVLSSFADLYSMYTFITDDGEVRRLEPDEEKMVLDMLGEEMTSKMYHAVATILGINKNMEDMMLISDVVITMVNIILDFPEIVNDTDLFFE